jgi:hypothetical protein
MALIPNSGLAREILPAALHRALLHVFAQRIPRCMLVGGTALAGYYAGHRRSDDLDLFVQDEDAHRSVILAVGSLRGIGASLEEVVSSAQYFKALCQLDGHAFTADVVLDANLFTVGESHRVDDGVVVASLETLLRQKAATLVSRCSEKDLYDLIWLFEAKPKLALSKLIELGAQIDAGLTTEACLTSLIGTRLSVSACGFSPTRTASEVFEDVTKLKAALEEAFDRLARRQAVHPIGHLVRALRG